jgi:acylglycerol lipase
MANNGYLLNREENTMFRNFELKEMDHKGQIIGYAWDLDTPEYVMCIIHGLGELAARYDRMNGYLERANIASVSMDLRGHGLSAGPRGHVAPRQTILQDIDTLIEYAMDRYPGVPLLLYGHSLGGNIALDYRCRGTYNQEPVAYLISAPWLILKKPPAPALRRVVKVLSKIAPAMAIKSAIDERDLGHPDSVKPYQTNPLVHDKISMLSAIEGLDIGEALVSGTHPDNDKAKGKPWLLMHGTQDKICDIQGSRKLYQRIPENCSFIPWEGFFHEIHNGNEESRGEEVLLKMIQWIGELKG